MMVITANEKILPAPLGVQNAEETSILKVLAYFDIFHYPLTKNEIRQFLDTTFTESKTDELLQQLLTNQTVFLYNEFYSLHNSALLADRRKEGNLRAERLLPKAFKIGRFLFRFPFVRAIGVSGSLSKNFADEKADIDFFIIVKANRLWISRTLMHLFKKLTFITGHQHYFCMNYYIDEEGLVIENQNIFTAIEIATLLPVCGKKTLDRFFAINSWRSRFLPGAFGQTHFQDEKPARSWFKRVAEWIFDNSMGNHLDKWLLTITTHRWQQKSRKGRRNKKGHMMNLITGKHFARSNPGAFQEKVLALYEQKLIDLKLI